MGKAGLVRMRRADPYAASRFRSLLPAPGSANIQQENPMYGLVNRALQQLVCASKGEQAWIEIRRQAGVDEEVFMRMDPYPDEVTYRLVGAASEVLDTPVPVLLREFGRYWTRYTLIEGYGAMLNDLGPTFHEALAALDSMHERVALLYPSLSPPTFRVTEITPDSLSLNYYSKRSSLGPMVHGLVEGLAERFGIAVDVRHAYAKGDAQDHDRFEIRILGPLAHDS